MAMSNHTPGPWRIEAITAEMRRGRGSARLKDYEFEIEPTKTYPRPDLELWKGQGGPPAFTIARIPIHSGCTGTRRATPASSLLPRSCSRRSRSTSA
jgi:hypothetical protein